ncbi:MAG TPA: hypothetical protein VGD80_14750 [Kofleriaceae bacterium]
MRVLAVVISLVCLALPSHAIARPKSRLAVAPFKGDPDGKIAEAVVDALAGKDFVVVTPGDVSREIGKLGVGDELDARAVRKLSTSLDVVAIVDGSVRKTAHKRTLRVEIHRRGKRATGFTVEFKTTTSAAFHRGVHDQVLKHLDAGEPQSDDADDDADRSIAGTDRKRASGEDDDADRKRKAAEDDDRKRKAADDEVADRKRRSPSDDGAGAKRGRSRSAAADDDRKRDASDDEPAVRKRKGGRSTGPSDAAAIARAGAGASVAQRQLTYDTRSGFTQIPPRVRTTAGGGRVDGELYPFALVEPGGKLAALGLAASYDKTFGLSIKIPNFEVKAPIDQSHYSLGARYRFAAGESSTVAVGLDYVRRHYIADRARLMALVLDTPDVNYMAVAPGVAARVPVTPAITILGGVDGLLMLETGPIQDRPSYGPATVYGLEGYAGVDVALTAQIGLRVALEYSRISLSFKGKGEMSTTRDNDVTTQDVNGAIDRSIGVAATVGLVY